MQLDTVVGYSQLQSDTVGVRIRKTGYRWIRLDTAVYSWIPLDTAGYSWIQLDTAGYSWIQLDTVRSNWIQLDTVGYGCIHSRIIFGVDAGVIKMLEKRFFA